MSNYVQNELIPIYKPYLDKYKTSAISAINSEWISNHGINIGLATNKLKELLNVNHVILMCNGTAATHCLFLALKYKYPEINKIYVPNNVFIACYNMSLLEYNNLSVLEIDESTLNLNESEEYLASLEENSALLVVHNAGNIINVPRIKRLRPDLVILEDNCEGFLGKYEGKLSGTESLCSALSFYGNKNLTTGEGGAFITNDTDIYNHINKIYSHGMTNRRYIHDVVAYNYRMTNIEAGFLYDQLCDIEHIINEKKNIFENYRNLILESSKIKQPQINLETEHANWIFTVIIETNKNYEDLEVEMKRQNIEIRPFFYDISEHFHLSIFETPNKLNQKVIMLPSYIGLSYEQQNHIIKTLESLL